MRLMVVQLRLALVFVFVKYHGPVINIILATLPVFAAIIFGSQQVGPSFFPFSADLV